MSCPQDLSREWCGPKQCRAGARSRKAYHHGLYELLPPRGPDLRSFPMLENPIKRGATMVQDPVIAMDHMVKVMYLHGNSIAISGKVKPDHDAAILA